MSRRDTQINRTDYRTQNALHKYAQLIFDKEQQQQQQNQWRKYAF